LFLCHKNLALRSTVQSAYLVQQSDFFYSTPVIASSLPATEVIVPSNTSEPSEADPIPAAEQEKEEEEAVEAAEVTTHSQEDQTEPEQPVVDDMPHTEQEIGDCEGDASKDDDYSGVMDQKDFVLKCFHLSFLSDSLGNKLFQQY
jgi:hypothetical protein